MKKLLMIILALICIFSVDEAYAANVVSPDQFLCTKGNQYELKKRAAEVKVTYHFEDTGKYKYFYLRVANMKPNLKIKVGNSTYKYIEGKTNFDLTDPYGIDGETVKVYFYGDRGHPCVDQFISLTEIRLPKYNIYSETDECVEYEEFPLCNRFYKGTINNYTEFKQKLDEYIKAVNTKPNTKTDSSIFEKIAIFFEDHPLVLALIIIASVCGVIAFAFIKIRNKLKRAKIKF